MPQIWVKPNFVAFFYFPKSARKKIIADSI